MSGIFYLSDRRLIKAGGADIEEFLQGLITNDIYLLKEKGVVFSCFLNPQGRFFADFFIYLIKGEIFIDINEGFLEDFLKKMKLYKLRSDVSLEEVKGKVYGVFSDFSVEGEMFEDVRSEKMGKRVVVFGDDKIESVDLSEYGKIRIDNLVPDGFYDLTLGKSFILEFGYDKLGAISFEKGCYVGQEVITRTHRRGVVRKSVGRFEVEKGDLKKGDEIELEGKKGVVCSFYGDGEKLIGLGLFRN